jgi:hypothetical protein
MPFSMVLSPVPYRLPALGRSRRSRAARRSNHLPPRCRSNSRLALRRGSGRRSVSIDSLLRCANLCTQRRPRLVRPDGGVNRRRKGRDSNPRSVLPDTRFPGARTRPTMRPFHSVGYRCGCPAAERAGFEPAVAINHTAFREQHLKPLGHLSARDCTKTSATLQERRLGNQGKKKPPQWAAVVRLAGFEPAAFGSATQRSIP